MEMIKQIKCLIERKEALDLEDDIAVNNIDLQLIILLCKDLDKTINCLDNLSYDEICSVQSLYEDISAHFKSEKLIECMKRNAVRTGAPDSDMEIDYAIKSMNYWLLSNNETCEKLKMIIDERNGYYGFEQLLYLKLETELLKKDLKETINCLNSLEKEYFACVKETFKNLFEYFKSKELIECIKANALRTGVDCVCELEYAIITLEYI